MLELLHRIVFHLFSTLEDLGKQPVVKDITVTVNGVRHTSWLSTSGSGLAKSQSLPLVDSLRSKTKVGRVFRMVISSELRMGQYIDDDYREDAPHFIT